MEFADTLVQHFRFLTDEFGYRITKIETDPKNFGNCLVQFESPSAGVDVILDRGQVFVTIGPLTTPEEEWFDICDVSPYFAPQMEAVYLFPEAVSSEVSLSYQLDRLSNLMKSYCSPILQGDFRMEREIRNHQTKRAEKLKDEMKSRYPHLKNLS